MMPGPVVRQLIELCHAHVTAALIRTALAKDYEHIVDHATS